MFGAWRNVVENLAQPQPRTGRTGRSESLDYSPERPGLTSRNSFDSASSGRVVAHSAGNLAENAFSNLRKSLASQRPFTVTSPEGRASPQPDRELRAVSKPTLEDRLRASLFAIGDASTSTTPDFTSHAPSPRPLNTPGHVLSPKSTPLPDSPVIVPAPGGDHSSLPPLDLLEPTQKDEPLVEINQKVEQVELQEGDITEATNAEQQQIDHPRIPEADVPLPPFSPVPTNLAASQSFQPPLSNERPQPAVETTRELAGQQRALEQRESGMLPVSTIRSSKY